MATPVGEGGVGAATQTASATDTSTAKAAATSPAKAYGASAIGSLGEAVAAVRTVDWLLLFILFFVCLASFHIHAMLTFGDWDFWVDWKDRRYWPTVTPIVLITFAAAAQAFFWEKFRLPFGATFMVLGLMVGEWINRYFNFWLWTYFPINMVWPTVLIPGALFLDIVLQVSRSYLVTAILGAMGWALIMYPANWPILAQFHVAVEKHGLVMTLADLIGFEYLRTGTPEYIRMVEKGTLRSFGQDVVPVSAFFAGFISMIVYFVWHFVGRWFSTTRIIGRL
jgi:methane/ammonia monooxygenase subunit A